MDIKITSNFENKLLNRKEIRFRALYSGKTPSKDELREMLCKTLNLNPNTTVIVNISQTYGMMSSAVLAHSYAKTEDMAIEPRHYAERISRKAKKGEEGAAASAPVKKEDANSEEKEEKAKPEKKDEDAKADEKKHEHTKAEEKKEHNEAPKEEEKKE